MTKEKEIWEIAKKLEFETMINELWYVDPSHIIDLKEYDEKKHNKIRDIRNILNPEKKREEYEFPPKLLGIFRIEYLEKIIQAAKFNNCSKIEILSHKIDHVNEKEDYPLLGFKYGKFISLFAPIVEIDDEEEEFN